MTGETPEHEHDAVTWFEPLYAEAARGARNIPWDRHAPHPLLLQWLNEADVVRSGHRAIVAGAGTGDDAAFIAESGFTTTAFDISPSAIAVARKRYPDAPVDLVAADLFDLPPGWTGGFDLVVEIQTVQALPRSLRASAIGQISRLVAPGGTVVAIAAATDVAREEGPPWPLTRDDLDGFERAGLTPVSIERIQTRSQSPFASHWLAQFARAIDDQAPGES